MTLYKYRSMSDQPVKKKDEQTGIEKDDLTELEKVRKTILDQEIWFAKPSTFNDPFDSFPAINVDGAEEQKVEFWERLINRDSPHKSREDIQTEARSAVRNGHDLQRLMDKMINRKYWDNFKTFCLSNTQRNILMWSHYANNHKGICLGFDSTPEKTVFGGAKKVKYCEDRYEIAWLDGDREEGLIESLYRKSDLWKYEQEWRIVYPGHRGSQDYKTEELEEIIFGSEISDEDRKLVMSWCDQLEHKPELFDASLHPRKYEMVITPI